MKPASRALRYIRPHRRLFVVGQLATLAASAAGLAFPLITRDVVDSFGNGGEGPSLQTSIILLATAFSALTVFTWIRERSLQALSLHVVYDLRDRLFSKVQRLRYEFFDRHPSGEIISIVTNDVNRFQDSVAGGLSFLLSQSVSLVAIVAILFTLDLTLTLIVVGMVPIFYLIVRTVSGKVRILSRKVQDLLSDVTSITGEVVRGVDVIKSYVLGSRALEIFRRRNRELTEVASHQVDWRAGSAAVSTFVGGAAVIALIGVGGVQVNRGAMTPGELVAYIVYAQMVVGPIAMLSGIVVEVQRALAAIERVFGLIDAEEEQLVDAASTATVGGSRQTNDLATVSEIPVEQRAGAEIRIESVSFSYGDGDSVLHDVTLTVAPGEFVALVGPSGAGKSTLLKLLVRFYDPDSGRILLDGVDIIEQSVEAVRNEMALVMQETHLFDMSVEDNLRCGRPDAPVLDVHAAAAAAQAAEFIASLPAGYASTIGENGTQLSGGQRQRLSLARAFLRSPRVLLLDEATSALDTESERRVQAALARLMVGRTTIAIAHRLSTVLHADRIVLMDGGRIVETAPHEVLIARNSLYADLCRHQMIQPPSDLPSVEV
ncbi:MAG: ABC transporter ATP-binding protein [Spirochaetaceae bacterium]